jgi:hypothetical protein
MNHHLNAKVVNSNLGNSIKINRNYESAKPNQIPNSQSYRKHVNESPTVFRRNIPSAQDKLLPDVTMRRTDSVKPPSDELILSRRTYNIQEEKSQPTPVEIQRLEINIDKNTKKGTVISSQKMMNSRSKFVSPQKDAILPLIR